MGEYVVTVTPTIMDGTVVRWHASVEAANECHPIISASRNAVVVHDEAAVTPALREAAGLAHRRLDRDRYVRKDDMRDLVTHERPTLFGDYVPAAAGEQTPEGPQQ